MQSINQASSIVSQLQKKDQALSYLGEEINIYLSTRKFYIKSPKNDSLFVSKNVDTTTKANSKQ